jgi:hypothetical protein
VADLLYPAIRDHLEDWLTADWLWMLLKSPFAPDLVAQQFVADIAADELTNGSYARVTASAKTVDGATVFPSLGSDNPDFGTPTGSETAIALALYREVTDDNDSVIAGVWDIKHTCDGTALVITFDGQPLVPLGYNPVGVWLLSGMAQHLLGIEQDP